MLFSFLALICFTLFGLFFKLSSYKKCDPVAVNATTLFSAFVAALFFFILISRQCNLRAGIFGLCGGSFLFVALLCTLYALKDGKISTSWTILNLGMVIPVIFSIVLWKETMDIKRIIGFALICSSIIFIGQDTK